MVQYCGGWRSDGTVLWRMMVGGYCTLGDRGWRVQHCGGWRSEGSNGGVWDLRGQRSRIRNTEVGVPKAGGRLWKTMKDGGQKLKTVKDRGQGKNNGGWRLGVREL